MSTVKQPKVGPRLTNLPLIAIIEMGGQFTLLIAQRCRELGYRTVILETKKAKQWLEKNPVRAVILSGGSSSVYESGSPQLPDNLFHLKGHDGKPVHILGICYGMQLLAFALNGTVQPVDGSREYGAAAIDLAKEHGLLFDRVTEHQDVWMSHGDSVSKLPPGFTPTATSNTSIVAAMESADHRIFGVQFHPEVHDTPCGVQVLKNFLETAGCEKDWVPESFVSSIEKKIAETVGDGLALVAYSGGVDSSLVAFLTAKALGKSAFAVTVDAGNFREGEIVEIKAHAKACGIQHRIIPARQRFTKALRGIIDAEKKRKRFRKEYVFNLKKAAADIAKSTGKKVTIYLIQGTLAPDRIESGATGGANIKTHHNVGLDFGDLVQVHPIDFLFKYEVRALAKEVGLPTSITERQPFPGPGLFLRINGAPVTLARLAIVRWADNEVRKILIEAGIYHQLSQVVISLNCVKTVGVKGDGRVYGYAIVARAVKTLDFMTAQGVHLSEEVEDKIASVLAQHKAIVRVYYDPTNKPPATTEPE